MLQNGHGDGPPLEDYEDLLPWEEEAEERYFLRDIVDELSPPAAAPKRKHSAKGKTACKNERCSLV